MKGSVRSTNITFYRLMLYMNDYDIAVAYSKCNSNPIMLRAVRFLDRFKDEVDAHSDGWAYWKLPVQAARQLMELIQSGRATEAQLNKAMAPIRRFYTMHGAKAGMEWPE